MLGPQTTPTPDVAAQQATINAMVTQTIQAIAHGMTATAMAQPTATFTVTATQAPTSTSTPVATAIPILPTAANTKIPATPKPSATATPGNYACQVTAASPSAGTKVTVGADFDASWTVKNTGIKNWEVGYVDLRYESGTKMQTKADAFDVTTAVPSGSSLTLIVDMKAPTTAGKYSATWIITMEGQTMCTMTVNIEAVSS